MRKTVFVQKEYYHIYNRGVDKRNIFTEPKELLRFLKSVKEFNTVELLDSIAENERRTNRELNSRPKKLVNIVAYCLNQNHFHFILEPLVNEGVQKFMHRLSTGYTNYFNEKHKRNGALFQGRYKAKHISSNEYLLHLGVYVNLNNLIHNNMNKEWMTKLPFSSFDEYKGITKDLICVKDILLDQFKNKAEFVKFCKNTLPSIQAHKKEMGEFKDICID